jgi:hypothetical protein
MSVIFSNGLLAYVWWSPDISAAGRWIMIFVPFFNVSSALRVEVMVVWSDVDGDLNILHWRCQSIVARVHRATWICMGRFIQRYSSRSRSRKRYLSPTASGKLVLQCHEHSFIPRTRMVLSSLLELTVGTLTRYYLMNSVSVRNRYFF